MMSKEKMVDDAIFGMTFEQVYAGVKDGTIEMDSFLIWLGFYTDRKYEEGYDAGYDAAQVALEYYGDGPST